MVAKGFTGQGYQSYYRKVAEMIPSGNVPALWNRQVILDLPFVHRTDYAASFQLRKSQDAQTYQQAIAIGHCSADNLDEVFLVVDEFSWLKDKVYTVHRFAPGAILPFHKDGYKKYQINHGIEDINQIHRIIVFLEDWKDGHILQVESKLYAHWKAGDFVSWHGETLHMAANLGHEDRYTLQITGTIKQ
jgi:hypothetical protein